ncbi:MAG: Gldg family protein [Planctomycetota bacterium]
MSRRVLLLVVLNLVAANILLLRGGLGLDATEEQLHGLSAETPDLLMALPDDSRIVFVASEQQQYPGFKPLIPLIRDKLAELRLAGKGRLQVEFVDPYVSEEKRSFVESRYGVNREPVPLSDGFSGLVYFAVVTSVGEQSETFTYRELVQQTPGRTGLVLANFESLVLRSLHKLSRQHMGLHQALLRAKADGGVKIMSLISEPVPPRFQATSALVKTAVKDLVARHAGSLAIEPARLEDEDFRKKLEATGIGAWQIPGEKPFFFHLLVGKGKISVEVPQLFSVTSAKDMQDRIERHILLLLNQSGRSVGLLVPPLPEGAPPYLDPFLGVQEELSRDVQVSRLPLPLVSMPPGIDTVVAMGLPKVDADTVRELDKFLMQGGRLILFVDRQEIDTSQMRFDLQPMDSGFEPLLEHWGVKLGTEVGRSRECLRMNWPRRVIVSRRPAIEPAMVDCPYVPVIRAENLPSSLPVSGIPSLCFSYPNTLTLGSTQALRVTPFLPAKGHYAAITADRTDPFDIDGNISLPKVEENALKDPLYGVLLEGSFQHYNTPGVTEDFVRKSSLSTRVAVVADADFLNSHFYLAPLRGAPGDTVQTQYRSNMQLLKNLVDWSFGDDAILKVSSRQARHRPLSEDAAPRRRAQLLSLGVPGLLLGLVGLWSWRRRRRPA